MKTLIYSILILALCSIFHSCTHEESLTALPNCIEDILNNPERSKDIKTIRVQAINHEMHYWLNTDFMHSDGTEEIINNSCENICYLCAECYPPECAQTYDNNWKIIWER